MVHSDKLVVGRLDVLMCLGVLEFWYSSIAVFIWPALDNVSSHILRVVRDKYVQSASIKDYLSECKSERLVVGRALIFA